MPYSNPKNRIYKKPFKPDYMTGLARELRKNPTESEQRLWDVLRRNNFFGLHFRRQVPFGRYIFDFYCAKMKVALEIDGPSHDDRKEYDATRDAAARASAITVLRFTDNEVREDIELVLKKIKAAISPPPPGPLSR